MTLYFQQLLTILKSNLEEVEVLGQINLKGMTKHKVKVEYCNNHSQLVKFTIPVMVIKPTIKQLIVFFEELEKIININCFSQVVFSKITGLTQSAISKSIHTLKLKGN